MQWAENVLVAAPTRPVAGVPTRRDAETPAHAHGLIRSAPQICCNTWTHDVRAILMWGAHAGILIQRRQDDKRFRPEQPRPHTTQAHQFTPGRH